MIAYAYLGAPRTTRQSRGAALGGTIFAVAGLRIVGFASIVASFNNPWAVVIPYTAIAATVGFGLYAISKGVIIETPTALTDAMNALGERIARRFAPKTSGHA